MSKTELTWYAQGVKRILGCSDDDAEMIKAIMADDILHTVALDWLTERQFRKAARETSELLEENRDMYEEHFATMRAMFAESKAAEASAVWQDSMPLIVEDTPDFSKSGS